MLKRAVIKEELVMLTGGYIEALILNQFLFWSNRGQHEDGWVYKTAEELSEETMLDLAKSSILRYVDRLTSHGWLEQRRNPKCKWDKTYQYKVNAEKIKIDLDKIGYSLEEYFDINDLCHMPYKDYLQTAHWTNLRSKALKHANYACQLCNGKDDLNVHHRTYERRGQELLSDLIVLCRNCHSKFHDKLA